MKKAVNGRCHCTRAPDFQVYETQTLPLTPGDKIRITQNGFAADGKHRLNNGAVFQVKGFTHAGDLKLSNGWVIDKDYGNLAHGYCQTSHVAQSKTVNHVFVAQSATSLGASSAEQFYVSVSRARDSVTVYTDDKARLIKAIQSSGARMTAHELLKLPAAAKIIDPFESILRDKGGIPFGEKIAVKPTPQKTKQTRKAENIETAQPGHQYRNHHFTRPAAHGHKISL